jgi:hypothetical protein
MLRVICCCVFLAGLTLASAALGVDSREDLTQAEIMEMAMELAGPGEEHELLKSLVGEWNMGVTLWMVPGAEPMYFKGNTSNETILGDRFLVSEGSSGEGDMYTETYWILGFDRRFEKYTCIGMDTWGTYYISATGDYDAKSTTLTMSGEVDDPLLGQEGFKIIFHLENKDRYVVEMIMINETLGIDEFKMLELVHTRR